MQSPYNSSCCASFPLPSWTSTDFILLKWENRFIRNQHRQISQLKKKVLSLERKDLWELWRCVTGICRGNLNTWLFMLTSMLDRGDSKGLFSISSCLSFSEASFNAGKKKKGKIIPQSARLSQLAVWGYGFVLFRFLNINYQLKVIIQINTK